MEIFDVAAKNRSRFSTRELGPRELPNDVRSTGNQLSVNFVSADEGSCPPNGRGFSAFVMKGIYKKNILHKIRL